MKNFSQDEAKVIYNDAKKKGLDPDKVMAELVNKGATFEGIDMNQARQYAQTKVPKAETTLGDKLKEAGQDITGIGKDIAESFSKRKSNIDTIRSEMQSGNQGDIRSIFQTAGQVAGGVSDAVGSVVTGVAKLPFSDKTEQDISNVISKFGAKVVADPKVQTVINKYNSLTPAQQRDVDAVGGIVSLVADVLGATAAKSGVTVAKETVGTGIDLAKSGARDVIETAVKTVDNVADSGAGQIVKDLAGRIPRAGERISDSLAENAVRAQKIKTASPLVQNAYKVNLDERIINTVSQADDATKQAYKQIVDIAEEAPKTVGTKKQPSIVSGDLAVKQYDLINKQKKAIGEQIGKVTKELSKTEKLNMQDSFQQIDDILANQGISPQYTKKGVKLDFTGSKYTPAERTKIQELYNLATEGGDSLSPAKIKDKDQLFSKLKREAQYEGVGDLIIETPDGSKSLFNVFRDIYSGKLDTISPEVRALNNEYRKLSQITEDIEDSIFKTPNFNVTKTVDPAEFAKVNMRRIFGEAQSSPVFEAVADVMDRASRGLGYKGATPKQVAEFAEYVRKLYPETVPKTGFQGGIKAGVSDIIEQVSKVGAPNLADQRKALVELLTTKKKARNLTPKK